MWVWVEWGVGWGWGALDVLLNKTPLVRGSETMRFKQLQKCQCCSRVV